MLNALVQQSLILTGTNLTTEQQFVLFFNASMEQSNYILNDRENILKNLKNVFGKYELNYLKNNIEYKLTLSNSSNGKMKIMLESTKKKITIERKPQNYIKNINLSKLDEKSLESFNTFFQDFIKDYESDPFSSNKQKNNINSNINNINNINNTFSNPEINNNPINNNPYTHNPYLQNNQRNRPYVPINGNLMGPNNFPFRPNMGNFGARYDPISPFGPEIDFAPQYDEFGVPINPFLRNRNDVFSDINPFGNINPNNNNNMFGGNFGGFI